LHTEGKGKPQITSGNKDFLGIVVAYQKVYRATVFFILLL